MKSKDKLNEMNIRNRIGHYFEYINVDGVLLDEKSYKNILVYNILYKKLMDTKPFRIRFNKIDGIITIYKGIRCLELFY